MGLRPLPSALTLGAAVLATVLAWEILTPAPALDAGGVAGELERERIASAAATLRVARDPAFLRGLGIPGPSVEGYLFPDTYQFVRGMTPEEILTRMVQRLRAKLTPDTLARSRGRGLDLHG